MDDGSHAIFVTDQGHMGTKSQCEKLEHLIGPPAQTEGTLGWDILVFMEAFLKDQRSSAFSGQLAFALGRTKDIFSEFGGQENHFASFGCVRKGQTEAEVFRILSVSCPRGRGTQLRNRVFLLLLLRTLRKPVS